MAVGVGLEQHVAFVNARPGANRGAVNPEARFERRLRQLVNRIRDVVPEAGNIGEAQVENLGVVLAGKIENGLGVRHKGSFVGATPFRASNCGRSCRRAGCYNRSHCAGLQSLELAVFAGNSIVFMTAIKPTLYWSR